MVLAFIAGMIFTALLAQTLTAADKDYSRTGGEAPSAERDSLIPAPAPEDNYLTDKGLYGLVNTRPAQEAMVSC